MKHRNIIEKGALSAAALLVFGSTAAAAQGDWSEIRTEIDSCIAEVGAHANYTDAKRVRHEVVDVDERTVGYKLTIRTAIYSQNGDAAIRAYATSCVVNGKHAPMQFSISEIADDA